MGELNSRRYEPGSKALRYICYARPCRRWTFSSKYMEWVNTKKRLLGSSLIPYIPLTFPESRTVFWWNPGNLVPRALPLKKWVGRRPFFKGKAVGTRLKSRILGIPFPNRYENYPLKQALSNFEKGNLPAWPWGLLILISFVMVHIFWDLFSALWFTVTEYIP